MAVLVISYSREDRTSVRQLVSLLRSALQGVERALFWDEDFEPGDLWFEQIQKQIDTTEQLFVFWCSHSAQSPQVNREFSYAFERNKRVVPVLLDNTPLSPELAPIHGIDLRAVVAHNEPPRPAMLRGDKLTRWFQSRSIYGIDDSSSSWAWEFEADIAARFEPFLRDQGVSNKWTR